MTERIRAINGMKDLFGVEIESWQKIESAARTHFARYGYGEIRTPILEETALFVRGIGTGTGVVQKEMYSFEDKGGENITMRPEGTASVVRAYIEHRLDTVDPTAKLFYIGPMFRHERPQKGRLRQFHQIGAELIGPASSDADVEVIELLDTFVRSVGISDFSLQINSLGCLTCRPPFQVKLKSFLESKKEHLCTDCQRRLENNAMRVFDCKNEKCQAELAEAPTMLEGLCEPCAIHFGEVKEGLNRLEVAYQVNPRIARGLDYYQRTAFELISQNLGSQSAFAGGGRYDGLISELGGAPQPAVGFAIGMERLIMLLPPMSDVFPEKLVYIAALGKLAREKGMGIASKLRKKGLTVEMDYGDKSLKAQLRRADKVKASHVVILGDNEIRENKAVIKDFRNKTQSEAPLDQLELHLTER